MKTILFCLIFIAPLFCLGNPGKECVDQVQIRALQKELKGIENRLRDVLRREITAELENEDASLEKENARQLYFKLRKARAELETAKGNFCQEKK